MYAQLIRGRTSPERHEEMSRLVRDTLVPSLKDEPGFSGALTLVHRATGEQLLVLLWETEEQASSRDLMGGPSVEDTLGMLDDGSPGAGTLPPVWEVGLEV